MILPIGHAERETRRIPWVTFGIMATCVVVFLATDPGSMQPGYDRESLLDDATMYWRDHAYLEPAPEIRTRVAYDVMPNQRTQYLELMVSQSYNTAPQDHAEWEVEQVELDRLTDQALGDALPPEIAESDDVYRKWGYLPETLLSLGLLTHIFMHAGWIHLLSNLFMFFLAGPPVEDRLGRPLFLGFFLAAGVFAAIFWGVFAIDKTMPLVGASGAIAGVLGAFFIRFWSTQIRFAYFLMVGFKPYLGTFEAQAWLMLPIWFGLEALNGWVAHSIGVGSGVAYMAHVGGFLFGTGIVLGIRAFGIEEKFIDAAIEKKITLVVANPVIDSAMALQAEGDHEAALAILQEAWREAPTDRDVALALWDAVQVVERPGEGVAAVVALMKQCVADADMELAIQHWLDLHRLVPTAVADAPTLLKLLPELQASEDPALAVRALRQCVDPANATLSVGLAMRVAEIAKDFDPPSALRAAKRAIQSEDLRQEGSPRGSDRRSRRSGRQRATGCLRGRSRDRGEVQCARDRRARVVAGAGDDGHRRVARSRGCRRTSAHPSAHPAVQPGPGAAADSRSAAARGATGGGGFSTASDSARGSERALRARFGRGTRARSHDGDGRAASFQRQQGGRCRADLAGR